MKQLIRTHTIVVALSAVLLLTVGGGLWWFESRLAAREARVIEVRDRLASFEQNKRQLSEETEKLALIKERVSSLETHLVTESTTPTLLTSIESMAEAEGIDFTLTAVAATSAVGANPAKLHIDFSAEGSFAGIQRFVSKLLAQPYQVEISRLSLYAMNDTNGRPGPWQLLAGIDIMSF